MTFAASDLLLAIVHHLLVFSLAGILAYEIAAIRPGMSAADVSRVAKVDMLYGLCAMLIVIAGFVRAIYAAKGWDYYAGNVYFWGKMIAFALVGALSAKPTFVLMKWRKAGAVNDGEMAQLRQLLWIEAGVFATIPVFAAAMARAG